MTLTPPEPDWDKPFPERVFDDADAQPPPMEKIGPPWSAEQIASLNAYQQCPFVHPFTCPGCNATLEAATAGWTCPRACGYTQQWAWDVMANGEWRKMAAAAAAAIGHNWPADGV